MKIDDFKQKKLRREKLSLLTCYDYPSAQIISESSIDAVLVGDSVAMAVHGHQNTLRATMPMMEMHTGAVARGLTKQFLISDLPFLSYRISKAKTVANVRRLIQAGAHAVKIEGADTEIYQTIDHLVSSGIAVLGHIGLTPQFLHQLGGYKVQGRTQEQAQALLNQARLLEKSGCCALVIECVPVETAKIITEKLAIPTIGIGAGIHTDGQILVWHDMLGLQDRFKPKFLKQYLTAKESISEAIERYAEEVRQAVFPCQQYSFTE